MRGLWASDVFAVKRSPSKTIFKTSKVVLASLICSICIAGLLQAEEFTSVLLSKKSKDFKTHRLFPNKELTEEKKDYIARYWDKIESTYTPAVFESTVTKYPRSIGNKISELAVVNWAIDSEHGRTVMQDWVQRAIKIDKWGNNHDAEISHLLFGLALVYDWHRNSLDPELRGALKKFLFEHARYQFEQTQLKSRISWSNSYWEDHFWVNYTSILVSGLALAKDEPAGMYWAQTAYDQINKSLELFSSDGSHHEGLNYSLYANQWLVRAMTILEAYDANMFRRTSYLKNYPRFFEAYSVDENFQTFFDTGDSPRSLWDVALTEIFLKLYLTYDTPVCKDLFLYYLNVPSKAKPGILWCVYGAIDERQDDRTIQLDKSAYFSSDLGLFIDKDYAGDRVQTAFLFKSGIPGGRTAYGHMQEGRDYRLALTHSHPDQNHLMVWTPDGFLLSDTGYKPKKWTLDHNSLVINGDGQMGEGSKWFKGSEIIHQKFTDDAGLTAGRIVTTDRLSVVSADAAMFYPKVNGLTEFGRTVIWMKDTGFLIIDKMKVNSPSNIERPFHSDFNFKQRSPGQYELDRSGAAMGYFKNLYPSINDVVIRDGRMVLAHRLQKSGYGVCFVSTSDVPVDLTEEPKGMRVTVSGPQPYEVTLKGQEMLTTKNGITSDAEWALVRDGEWLFFQATHIEIGEQKIWAGATPKNLRFHYDEKSAGLKPQVEELSGVN